MKGNERGRVGNERDEQAKSSRVRILGWRSDVRYDPLRCGVVVCSDMSILLCKPCVGFRECR